MTKQKLRLLIPLSVIAAFLIYSLIAFLQKEALPTWRHFVGLILFIALVILFFKSLKVATLATGIYLLLGTFNILAMEPVIGVSWFNIGPVSTPPLQMLSLAIFTLYFFVNLDVLINIYLDYKEQKININRYNENDKKKA